MFLLRWTLAGVTPITTAQRHSSGRRRLWSRLIPRRQSLIRRLCTQTLLDDDGFLVVLAETTPDSRRRWLRALPLSKPERQYTGRPINAVKLSEESIGMIHGWHQEIDTLMRRPYYVNHDTKEWSWEARRGETDIAEAGPPGTPCIFSSRAGAGRRCGFIVRAAEMCSFALVRADARPPALTPCICSFAASAGRCSPPALLACVLLALVRVWKVRRHTPACFGVEILRVHAQRGRGRGRERP